MNCKHVGKKFGRLTALNVQEVRRTPAGGYVQMIRCVCDCGAERVTALTNLTSGRAKACKRCARPHMGALSQRHPLYPSYRGMLSRCYDPGTPHYKDYGGRGITVCERWRGCAGVQLDGFANFVADMGERPPGTTLDREDNDGPYDPGNCRWATTLEQANNTRGNRYLEVNGRRQTLTQWLRELDVDERRLRHPLKIGFSLETVIQTIMDQRAQGNYGSIPWKRLTPS